MTRPVLPRKVILKEVGPRDGLQNEKVLIPLQAKLQLIRDLVAAGLKYIEVTAFVSPGAVPQLADAREVARRLPRRRDVTFAALFTLSVLAVALYYGVDALLRRLVPWQHESLGEEDAD